jgi:Family of unknown function (DUF6527)
VAVTRLGGLVQRLILLLRRPHFRGIARAGGLDEIPDRLDPELVYVTGAPRQKWAVFACPCPSGHRIVLSLQDSHPRRWRLVADWGLPTLYPSVWLRDSPFCHFLVRSGRILWVRDDG